MTISFGHITISYGHITISEGHITILYDHINTLSDHITIRRDHITMLYDHITISCHEIMRSHLQMKAQGHEASLQATPRPAQGTASHPKANIRLRVPNRHIKSARKLVVPGRNYTFYRMILQKTF